MNKTEWTEEELDNGKMLRRAIKRMQIAEINELCASYPYLVADTFPGFPDSPVTVAARTQHLGVVTRLLQLGFTATPKLDETETTPLEEAVSLTGSESQEIVTLLLRHGANPNQGRPMVAAINVEDESIAFQYVKILVENGCQLNRVYDLYGDFDNGFTALDWADSKPKIADYLRSCGGLSKCEVVASPTKRR